MAAAALIKISGYGLDALSPSANFVLKYLSKSKRLNRLMFAGCEEPNISVSPAFSNLQ